MTSKLTDDSFVDTRAAEDLFSRPITRSDEFWAAMIALGGTPEMVAPHVPEMSEQQVAGKLAEAMGKASSPAAGRVPGGPSGYRSSWGVRMRTR